MTTLDSKMCEDVDCCVHVRTQNSDLEDTGNASTPILVKVKMSCSFIKMFYLSCRHGLLPIAKWK
jgi:hypothetical protein